MYRNRHNITALGAMDGLVAADYYIGTPEYGGRQNDKFAQQICVHRQSNGRRSLRSHPPLPNRSIHGFRVITHTLVSQNRIRFAPQFQVPVTSACVSVPPHPSMIPAAFPL